jgi:hypothetical protein
MATTHPTSVQPRKKLITATEPTHGLFHAAALGRKYKRTRATNRKSAGAADPESNASISIRVPHRTVTVLKQKMIVNA